MKFHFNRKSFIKKCSKKLMWIFHCKTKKKNQKIIPKVWNLWEKKPKDFKISEMFAKNDRFLGCIFAKKWPNSRNETKKNVNFPKIKNTSDESPFFFPKVCFNLPPKILFSLFFLKPRCEKWKFVMKPVKSVIL